MASAFNALLSNVRSSNQAMASMGQARAGMVAAKERQEIQRAEQEIADKQLAEETRRAKQEAKAKRKGTAGGFIGGLLGPTAGTFLAGLAGVTLGPLGIALAAGAGGYLGSKAGTDLGIKGGVSYKYKPINEADISNLSSGYFYKPEREQIEYDIGRINTEGRSMEDIFKMSKEGVAQQMAVSSALRAFGSEVFKGGGKDMWKIFKDAPGATTATGVATGGPQLTELLDPNAPMAMQQAEAGGQLGLTTVTPSELLAGTLSPTNIPIQQAAGVYSPEFASMMSGSTMTPWQLGGLISETGGSTGYGAGGATNFLDLMAQGRQGYDPFLASFRVR